PLRSPLFPYTTLFRSEDIEIAAAQDGREARFLMEPSPFARLVQLAEVRRDDLVLDVGCATGYSSAVLSMIAGEVVALESDSGLADRKSTRLNSSHVKI